MRTTIRIALNEKMYLRDPELTDLGRTICRESIRLIDELGFEQFTFKKLATAIDSTEASIYRYFENKHKLLIYLISWYWAWLDYLIDYQTHNIPDPYQRIKIVLRIISESGSESPDHLYMDRMALHRIVVAEASKAYLTKWVDADNREGLFRNYKALCHKIALIVLEINPEYPYSHAIVSTLLEAAHQQIFFAGHLPSLTEAKVSGSDYSQIYAFLEDTLMKVMRNG